MLFSSASNIENGEMADNLSALSSSTISTIAEIAVAVGIAIVFLIILKKFFNKYSGPDVKEISKEKKTMMKILYSVLRFAVILLCVLAILSIMGMDIGGAFAACGIAAACGALAVQDLLKDLIQGMNIVSDHFFSMGDIIEYNGFTGKVISLTMRSTKIKALEDSTVKTIGNHFLTDVNLVSTNVNLMVPLPYELDYEKAHEIMKELAKRIDKIETVDDAVFKGTQAFEDSYITYLIVYHCNPEFKLQTKRDVNFQIQKILKENDISIPYPQMDVHMK